MALKNNTWKLNQWYDQDVAGNVSYTLTETFFTWGSNSYGLLGQGQSSPAFEAKSSPVQFPGDWAAISIGTGLKPVEGGTLGLFMWGANWNARLGLNDTTQRSSPTQIPGSWKHVCYTKGSSGAAIRTDGTLWMWGVNTNGQVGQNSTAVPRYSSPKQVGSDTTWKYVQTAGNWVMATKTDGSLWSWGQNNTGQLGHNERNVHYSSPAQVGTGTDWKSVNSNQYGNIAVKTDGTAWSWGHNEMGQLMHNNKTAYSSPTQIPGTDWDNTIGDITNAAGNPNGSGSLHMLRKTNGNIYWAGQDGSGVAAFNKKDSQAMRSSPVELGGGTSWAGFAQSKNFKYAANFGGWSTMLAVTPGGQLWAWGSNSKGKLGQNDVSYGAVSSPIQIPGTWSTTMRPGGGHGESVGWFKEP